MNEEQLNKLINTIEITIEDIDLSDINFNELFLEENYE